VTEILRFRVEKLIRDKLPSIMRASGLSVFDRTLGQDEFVESLKLKLTEESAEVAEAGSADELLGELADVMEVVLALTQAHGFTLDEVEARRIAKREERGGFDNRVYNAAVEAPADCPALAYYVARPDKYPRA
jgi:predicted house-cleaning noncanonical NTP pyrophosphatase (MazG superfamily)